MRGKEADICFRHFLTRLFCLLVPVFCRWYGVHLVVPPFLWYPFGWNPWRLPALQAFQAQGSIRNSRRGFALFLFVEDLFCFYSWDLHDVQVNTYELNTLFLVELRRETMKPIMTTDILPPAAPPAGCPHELGWAKSLVQASFRAFTRQLAFSRQLIGESRCINSNKLAHHDLYIFSFVVSCFRWSLPLVGHTCRERHPPHWFLIHLVVSRRFSLVLAVWLFHSMYMSVNVVKFQLLKKK